MATCPNIKYGISGNGATEVSLQTGRELFRCGAGDTGCVRLYITNVMLDASTVKTTCASISDAIAGQVCMQSANLNWKDQAVVNWIAKDGVDSTAPVGTVITRVASCAGDSVVYTHTEGQISAKVLSNFENMYLNKDDIINNAKLKLSEASISTEGNNGVYDLQWVLSDLSVNISPTDWRGGGVTFQGFGMRTGGTNKSYKLSYSWQNGRGEESFGETFYDMDSTPELLQDVVATLMSTASSSYSFSD